MRRIEPLWGTVITLDVRSTVSPDYGNNVFAWFRRVDDLFSTWRPESEISRLGRLELAIEEASPEVRIVLDLCERVRHDSGGAFDVRFAQDDRVTPREGFAPIDPSGLVKGWALQRAAELLRHDGITDFSINAGGDVITAGHPEPGQPWRVGIQHPSQRDKIAAAVAVTDLGVATSGRYERGDHIIDPRTGRHATANRSVTVIANDLALADGYATAALALGPAGMRWLDSLPGLASMAITEDDTITFNDSFAALRLL
ncbi:MAG: FAD:protein FMN transferase [Acidimicrobiales bacterium]